MLIIPAIDLQQGRCVRLRQGQFNQITRYNSSPITLAQDYAQQGASVLHVVDLDGAQQGEITQLALIKEMQDKRLTIQVGGGIRSLASAKSCLDMGINKLVLGSIAVTNPQLTGEIIQLAKPENIILAFDVNIVLDIPKPAIHGWQKDTDKNLWELVTYYQGLGINQVLCTDIARDGMLKGPNFNLYSEALERFSTIDWQASGGIRDRYDLDQLAKLGLAGAILGRMLYESDFELSSYLLKEKELC